MLAGAAFWNRTRTTPIPTVSTAFVLMRQGGDVKSNPRGRFAGPARSPLHIPRAPPPGIEPGSDVLEASLRPSLGDVAPRTGIEPVSLARQASRDPSRVTRQSASGSSRTIAEPCRKRRAGSAGGSGVTYGFRSRRRCIHSAPGSPAPSRHSLAMLNRTASSPPRTECLTSRPWPGSGSPRLRAALLRSSAGCNH